MEPTGPIPAGVIEDSSGNLFGTTDTVAQSNDGTVFEIVNGERHDHHARLVQWNQRGKSHGGRDRGLQRQSLRHHLAAALSADGTVFEIVKGSGTITTLASFNGTNGANP